MDINHISYSKDLPQLNPSRSLFIASSSAPFLSFSSTAGDPLASEEAVDEQPSARKVKLLCSFGGKILPRPSDGVLRYAGGQTRIIAVRRDIVLPELYRKMTDAYGGPVAIRYQLPDEDLDALVSVSSTEDLDNMMDEYDKLAEGSVDGSAKLRVFLFSQAEIASAMAESFSPGPALIDPYDSGQKYIEAVNGGVISEASTGAGGGETRLKGSTASATSTQNSDMGFDAYNNEGTSPPVLSPTAGASAFIDPSKLAFVGTATSVPLQEAHSFPASSSILGQTMVAAHPSNPPQVVPYPSPAFVNTPRMGNVASVPQHAYLPPMTMAPASMLSQVGSMKPVQVKVDPFSEEDQFGGTLVPPVSDPNYKVFSQPLSQIPPLQSSHLQPPSVEWHELNLVPPLPKGPQLRFEDCQMCQKALPHVHSDMLINELGNTSGNSIPKVHPMLHSHHSDDISTLHGQHRVVSVAMKESLVESKVEHTGNPNQNGICGVNKAPVSVLDKEKFFMPTTEKIDHSKLIQPLGAVGLSGDTQASYGVIVNPPQSHLEGFFHQQQNQVLHPSGTMGLSSSRETSFGVPLRPPRPHHEESFQQQQFLAATVPPFIPLKQIVSGNQFSRDSILANVNYNALELLNQTQDYVQQVDGITQALNVNTFDILRSKGQLKPTVVPITDVSKDMKPESLFVIGDNHTLRPHNGGNVLFSSNGFISTMVGPEEISDKLVNPLISNSGISGEVKYESSSVAGEDNNTVKSNRVGSRLPLRDPFVSPGFLPKEYPINPLLSTTMDLHLFELANTSQISTMAGSSVLTQNMERHAKPIYLNQQVPGMSSYFADTSYTNTCIGGTSGAWTGEVSQPQNLINNLSAPQRGNSPFPLPSSTILGHDEQFQDTFASSSLLGNENCQEILESINTYLPRVAFVPSREPTVSGDTSNENHFSKVDVPDIAMLLEEGALQPPPDWLIKNSYPESGADFINQDLGDLTKKDQDSMLPSSKPPAPVLSYIGPKELNPPFIKGTGLSEENSNSQSAAVLGDQKIEDIKVKQSNKLHMGMPNAKDIGRLQIIKNCDLEELRELGSGTFGTVYHGKWRGSDVAIKRINDRCFAGKPSEQEKMRGDFWNEASKLADLHHPNVVAFYGVVLDGPGGSFSTVTEYMVNGSLRSALQRNDKTIDRRKQLIIAMDVAFGMEYLHGKNIVHFDLKSDNLLVNLRDPQRPICKVGDLGLSKVKCQTLISGGVRGTLPWMAPELLNGSSNLVSDKVDVFSYGIVMWELLTGEEPYSDLHYGTIIGGIVSNTLRPPVPENCDPEWRALMEQCWSAEPSERPGFAEIANRLRAMAPSLPQKGKSQK